MRFSPWCFKTAFRPQPHTPSNADKASQSILDSIKKRYTHCSKCGAAMKIVGSSPKDNKDYQCPDCKNLNFSVE